MFCSLEAEEGGNETGEEDRNRNVLKGEEV